MNIKSDIPHCEICKQRLHSIFQELNKEDLEKLSLHKGCDFHKPGQVLFHERSHAIGLFCISRGKVKLYKTGKKGKEHIVRLAKEGEVLGYRALISGVPYAASAAVLEDAAICFIPKNTFFNLLKKNSSLSIRVMRLLCLDIGVAEQKELSLAQKPVRERLAELLLMLKEFYGYKDDGVTINGSISREELANMIGTATETLIRLLSEFKQEGVLDLDKKTIKILNTETLVGIARLLD